MFTTNTLFILGAGASIPYGYPSGRMLVDNIINDITNDDILVPFYPSSPPNKVNFDMSDIGDNKKYDFAKCSDVYKNLVEYANTIDERNLMQLDGQRNFHINIESFKHSFVKVKLEMIDEFFRLKHALEIFSPVSIDSFLRDNPSYAEVGKTMIMYSLLKRESKEAFSWKKSDGDGESICSSDNWYSLLLNDLATGCAENPESITDNKVRFITFNYDVSLDYYLNSRISDTEIFSTEDNGDISPSKKFLNEMQINHVYGQLYSDLTPNAYARYEHKNTYSPKNVLLINLMRLVFSLSENENIKTMFSDRTSLHEGEGVIEHHKALINWAEEVIIIGFGFDRDNLDILGIPDSLGALRQFFARKTVRYLNYKGNMTSLDKEFVKLEESANQLPSKTALKIISSTANSVSSAYLNDFKKILFR